jgi:hypothetical protein
MANLAADNLIAFFSGQPLLTPLNPGVLTAALTAQPVAPARRI